MTLREATDVLGLLTDNGIRLKRRAPGVWGRATCPKCEGGKEREESLAVRIDNDEKGAIWKCHRGTCGWEGNGRVAGAGRADGAESRPQRPEREVKPPPAHPPQIVTNKPPGLYKFFADRGINQDTVDLFGCYVAKRWFPKHADLEEGEHPAIVFPYVFGGRTTNRKYRSTKKMFMQEKDALPTLYNIDAIDETDPQIVVWCEGEADCMAIHQSGYPQVVTLPNGAPAKLRDEDDPAREHDERFAPLRTHAEMLGKVKKFILAGDMDGPGQVLREELARRLGRHRCWIVTWPEGCKDAGDVLQKHGAERVAECIETATPYPIRGVYYVRPGTLEAYREEVPPPLLSTGLTSLDRVLKLPSDGRLIVTTGYPGSGKALALDTPVPTPSGWTTMGALQKGDHIYAPDGTITMVEEAWPVLHDRPCYRMKFSDGTTIVADAEHQWVTRCDKARVSENHRRRNRGHRETVLPRGTDQSHLRTYPSAKTTEQIAQTLRTKGSRGGVRRINHCIAVAMPIEAEIEWPLSIAPYTLGAWLGDGTHSNGGFTSADPEIIERIRKDGFEVRKGKPRYLWHIHDLKVRLRDHRLLGNKRIPSACLRAPAEDRRALLQGLMDTDGYVGRAGTAEFCSTNRNLAEAVFELLASLGYKPVWREAKAKLYGKDCGTKYRVFFAPDLDAFGLPRKLARIRLSGRSVARNGWRQIIAVDPVPSVPVRCIKVTHPSAQFLVGKSMIPTHNSSLIRYLMVHTALEHDRRWMVYSPEMSPWRRFAATIAEVRIGEPFRDRHGHKAMPKTALRTVERWMSGRFVFLASDAEDEAPTVEWILERTRMEVIRFGVTDLLIDPWNQVSHDFGRMNETQYIERQLQIVAGFGQRHGVNTWIVAHPIKPHGVKSGEEGPPPPSLYDIAGSATWFNRCDIGLVVHRPPGKHTEIHLRKARFDEYGEKGGMALAEYEKWSGRFLTPHSELFKEGDRE